MPDFSGNFRLKKLFLVAYPWKNPLVQQKHRRTCHGKSEKFRLACSYCCTSATVNLVTRYLPLSPWAHTNLTRWLTFPSGLDIFGSPSSTSWQPILVFSLASKIAEIGLRGALTLIHPLETRPILSLVAKSRCVSKTCRNTSTLWGVICDTR